MAPPEKPETPGSCCPLAEPEEEEPAGKQVKMVPSVHDMIVASAPNSSTTAVDTADADDDKQVTVDPEALPALHASTPNMRVFVLKLKRAAKVEIVYCGDDHVLLSVAL